MGKWVKILRETLEAVREGSYLIGDRKIALPFDSEQLGQVRYYSPERIGHLMETAPAVCPDAGKPCVRLANMDTLEAAEKLNKKRKDREKPVLVLNFANPHRPGGGVRQRPGTQEEHLCVKTTVLYSLETPEAEPFYRTNLECGTQAQTDVILFTPNAAVIRSPDLSLRADPFPVAVMTVSAPIAIRMEPEELSGLEEILLRRIRAMLRAALAEGYSRIVLGAWGCGNFGNDSELVAKLFYKALQEPVQPGDRKRIRHCFADIIFAVVDRSEELLCYGSFAKYFREWTQVDFFRQHTHETCGISCILMLLHRYGRIKYPTPRQEKKLYDLYRSRAFAGVTGPSAANCLAKNGLEVTLIHSYDSCIENAEGYFEPELYGNLAREYEADEQACGERVRIRAGEEFDWKDLKGYLTGGKHVMLQCIVDGDADGIHDRVLHWILLYGFDGKKFLACDTCSSKRRFTSEELSAYMDTPIGKICIVVGEKK